MTETTSGWTVDRLKDVAEINLDTLGTNTPEDFAFGYLEISNVNYFGIVSEDAIEQISFEDAPSRARRVVKNNDVLVSSVRPNLQAIAHIGNLGDGNLICSTGFNVVTSKRHKVFDKFLYWFLLSEGTRQYFEAVAKGVGYPALDDKDFEATNIPLFPIPVQKRIATYLDASCTAIDRAVETKQKQLENLDILRRSIIQKAVTQGLDPNVELKEAGVELIGPIPAHWQVKKLKRLFSKIEYGISESTQQEGKFAVLKMGNIVQGEIAFTKIEYVNEVSSQLLLDKDDLLFNRTNSLDQVAKVGIFRGDSGEDITFASYLVRLRTDHKNFSHYINYLVNTEAFLGLARKMAIPSVQQANLNPTRYGRLEVPVPPLSEQKQIAVYLDEKTQQISAVVQCIEHQITTLTNYRKSLIHECVTGKRRITEADLAKVGANV